MWPCHRHYIFLNCHHRRRQPRPEASTPCKPTHAVYARIANGLRRDDYLRHAAELTITPSRISSSCHHRRRKVAVSSPSTVRRLAFLVSPRLAAASATTHRNPATSSRRWRPSQWQSEICKSFKVTQSNRNEMAAAQHRRNNVDHLCDVACQRRWRYGGRASERNDGSIPAARFIGCYLVPRFRSRRSHRNALWPS